MKILLGSDTYPPDINGATRFTERLAHGLAGRGYDVHVVAPSPTGPAGRTRARGVTVHRLRSYRYPGQRASGSPCRGRRRGRSPGW